VKRRAFGKNRARDTFGAHEAAFPATCDVKIAAAKNLKKIFAQGRQKRIAPERNRSKTSESVRSDSARARSSHMQPRCVTAGSSSLLPGAARSERRRAHVARAPATAGASRRVPDQLRRVKGRACV
jgi:hypothetical protein